MSGTISSLPCDRRYRWQVLIESDPAELQGWLRRYVTTYPEEALSLLAEMPQLAVASSDRKK